MVIICISLSNLFPYNLKWKLFLLYWYVFNSKWSVFCQVTSVLVLSRILLDLFILDSKPPRFMELGLTLLVQGAQCAHTFFRKLFLHEKRGLEVQIFKLFLIHYKLSENQQKWLVFQGAYILNPHTIRVNLVEVPSNSYWIFVGLPHCNI